MKQTLAFTGTATAFCVLAAYFGFRFGQMSVDLDATCPAYARKARAAQVKAIEIATEAVGLAEQCRRELQVCETSKVRN